MDYKALEKCSLFLNIPADEIRNDLESAAYHVQNFEKNETIFHMMAEADRIGIVLKGRVIAQKTFPNGSQINVSTRLPGDLVGAAAVFSRNHCYPCDVAALEQVSLLVLRKEDMFLLMQKDIRILQNFTAQIATAAYMLQQRLELLSYSGIAQKAAFWLLIHARQSGSLKVRIPDSVSAWAMVMNVSRPSLHRELKKLEDEGIILYQPPFIEIMDAEALQDVLSR